MSALTSKASHESQNPKPEITGPRPSVPKILRYATSPPTIIAQGAEAIVYKSTYVVDTLQCALKYRPPKPYRHPTLDQRLTRQRILAEARIVAKCRREGLLVPGLYGLNSAEGWLALQWVEGEVIKALLRRRGDISNESQDISKFLNLMQRIGRAIGALHRAGIVHGDLTTSNMILQPAGKADKHEKSSTEEGDFDGHICLIDFGLASQSAHEEDRAVDLYVLEKAFGSTHPKAEKYFEHILQGYSDTHKSASAVLRRLEDVRMRGRKRSMVG